MFNLKNIALSFCTMFIAGSVAIAAEIKPANELSTKFTETKSESLANEAEEMLNSGDLILASELLNESIKSKKTVRNLTLKGDQYAKDHMKSNALYFYQKALVEGISNNPNFNVEPIQLKIMKLNPTAKYLEAQADQLAFNRQYKGATKLYIKAMNKALKASNVELISQIQAKVSNIN